MKVQAHRYHDFCAGHRVVGHENKCRNLHGHNYRVTFYVEAEKLDTVGRVVDFSIIDKKLCQWVEEHWDHRMLIWDHDPDVPLNALMIEKLGFMFVPFNPTAENMATYLLKNIGPILLKTESEYHGITLVRVDLLETRKCGVRVTL